MIISVAEWKEMTLQAFRGIPMALLLTAFVFLFSSVLGFFIAVSRQNPKHRISNKILAVYISFERGCPAIVQILLLYTILPRILDSIFKTLGSDIRPSNFNSFFYAVIILTLIQTAFLSETFRGGLRSIDKGQYEAAVCSGYSNFQAYIRIIIPQVLTLLLPVLCTSLTGVIKMTALSFVMTVPDIMAYPKIRAGKNFHFSEAYLGMMVAYVVVCLTVGLIFKLLERRSNRIQSSGNLSSHNKRRRSEYVEN